MALPLTKHGRGEVHNSSSPDLRQVSKHCRLFTHYQDYSRELLSFLQLAVLLSYEQ
jgi:hypothetical protein